MTVLKARHALFGSLIAAATLLAGCNTTPQDRQQALDIVDSPIALNQQQVEWKTPFWERGAQQGNAAPDNTAEPPSFVKRNEPLGNVGLIVDGAVDPALPQALGQQAGAYGLLVLPRPLLADAMQHARGCDQPTSTACLSSLAVYPGVRLLVRLTPAANGQVAVQVQDTRLDKSYRQTVGGSADSARALLNGMASQAAMAPWAAQPFAGGDGSLYISAGRVNGLAEGTELAVREPGQPVRTPTGQVVAWHPGKIVGKARVAQWVSATLSRVVPLSGTAPGPDYRLTLEPNP